MTEHSVDRDSTVRDVAQVRHGLDVEIPTIKILLYTDDPVNVSPTDEHKDLGLVKMLEHLRAREPAFAKFCIKWVSRNSSPTSHADQKLDDVLNKESQTGQPFEEIWFFGLHQANKRTFSMRVFRGGPESELTQSEVLTLQTWMQDGGTNTAVGGGVLMAGDHNHPRPADTIPSTNPICSATNEEPFLGRGRAIGRCVPRAGLLRDWEGDPTNVANHSNNTIFNSGIQTDRFPQRLTLVNVDANGDPSPQGQPHPLFNYKPGQYIECFPDHNHEGALVEIDPVGDLWPKGIKAQVVARGIDQVHAKLLDIIIAYNGDRADVGRIVADSSWHHYFNVNLRPFSYPSSEGSPADQIGQFYANLAIWLAPRTIRTNMALAMCWRLATYTVFMEPLGDVWHIGREALSILIQVASPCEVNEVIQAMVPERLKSIRFPLDAAVVSHLPPLELLLGCVLSSYHVEMIRDETSDDSYEPLGVEKVIERGITAALERHAATLERLASRTRELLGS